LPFLPISGIHAATIPFTHSKQPQQWEAIMKKGAVVLVLVGIFAFSGVGAAVAKSYTVTICISGLTAHIIATEVGTVGGKKVYNLNGFTELGELLSGTGTVYGDVFHWGLTRQTAMDFTPPVVLEFTTDRVLNGTGVSQALVSGEGSTPVTIGPGPCPE
jgi:hypothetical protein